MKQRAFEEEHEARWIAFAERVDAVDALRGRRPSGDARDEMAAFPDAYRKICRDLAVAIERRYSPGLVDRLNRLALDGHRILYVHDTNLARRAARFFARDFPRAVRRDWRSVAVASLLFYGVGALIAAFVTYAPELIYSVMSPEEVRSFEAMYDPAAEHIGTDRAASGDVYMFGFYIMNNIGIAFRAYAGGLLFGIGSALILFLNGISFGALSAHVAHIGFERPFFSFVIAHGAFELTAIVLAGAAGLGLGWSLVAPGPRSRLASLQRAARESMTIVWGVFAMLVVAAVVEAFWSSKGNIAAEIKLVVGAGCWILVLAYLLFAGRSRAGHIS